MRQPFNMSIREAKTSQSNINHRLRIQTTENLLSDLIRHSLKRPLQACAHVRESAEESWPWGEMVEHLAPYLRGKEAPIDARRVRRVFEGIVEAVAGPEEDFAEAWGWEWRGDADVAEEVPAGGDEGGEVVEGEAGEDVEH